MARLSYEERREEILRAALVVIARRGFGATTTREVTRQAGVNHGLLHHYFPSRDGLLAAAFDLAATEELAQLRRELSRGRDALDRLRRFVRAYGPTSDDPLVVLWLDAWSEATRNDELRATANRLNRAWVDLLTEVVAAGVAEGVFQVEDPTGAAWLAMAMLDGLAIQLAVRGGVRPRTVQRLVRRGIEEQLGLDPGTLGAR